MSMNDTLKPGAFPSFDTWQSREMYLWAQFTRHTLVVAILFSTVTRLTDQLLTPAHRDPVFALTAGSLLLLSVVILVHKRWGLHSRLLVAFLNLTQAYLIGMGRVLYPDCVMLLSVSSTLVFGIYEVQSFHPRWLVVLLYVRHFVVWCWMSAQTNTGEKCEIPYSMGILGIGIVVVSTRELRNNAMTNFEFYDSIRKHEAKMKAVLEAIPEGLAVIEENEEISCYNDTVLSILCIRDPSSILASIGKLHCLKNIDPCDESDVPLLTQINKFTRNSEQALCTFGVTEIQGKFFEWKGTKCHWGDSPACIVTASESTSWVSAQIKLEQESKSKSALLRFVSHELRTPANAILHLTSSVMEADNLTEKQHTELSIVMTSTHFLLSVVNDLLDFTRMIADKFALVKHSFDLRKEIEETVKLVELQCKQKGISLRGNVDSLIPQLIYSDATRLKQVLLNLLGNALKFTFHGGIRVICMLTNRSTVKISVKDTGLGIAKDKIAGLCQVFGTVEGTQRINPQGCGLGLYISNLLALSLGSKPIDIQSKIGMGSEFSFEVNMYQEEVINTETSPYSLSTIQDDERETLSEVSCSNLQASGGLHSLLPPSILVVDDSDFNRLVLVKMLGALGQKADEAASGLRALTQVRETARRGHCYRLIFMDMEMPEMDGVTATQEIRAMEVTGELLSRSRIVSCTAHRGQEDIERCIAAGMDDYLEKPISRAKLQELVSNL